MAISTEKLAEMQVDRPIEWAELCILGSCFLDPRALINAEAQLKPESFTIRENREIFSCMLSFKESGDAVDEMTVCAALERCGRLDDAGGFYYISCLAELTPSSANVDSYIALIAEAHALRRLDLAASMIQSETGHPDANALAIIADATQTLNEIGAGKRKQLPAFAETLKATIDRIEKAAKSDGNYNGAKTGIDELDRILVTIAPGQFVVFAARPGVGKTCLALNICQATTFSANKRTLFFSLEMSEHELTERLIAATARIDHTALRSGAIARSETAMTKMLQAVSRMNSAPLHILSYPTLSIAEMRATLLKAKNDGPIDLVIVDYLQLMKAGTSRDIREQEVAEISRGLKSIAIEFQLPVVALAQLNRESERNKRKPQLSDLRESGQIEQDADVVAFIHREEMFSQQPGNKNKAEIIVAKNRSGSTGACEARFLGQFCRFDNL